MHASIVVEQSIFVMYACKYCSRTANICYVCMQVLKNSQYLLGTHASIIVEQPIFVMYATMHASIVVQ